MSERPNEEATIILPLPKRILSPNCPCASRGGRIAKACAAKKYRRQAKEAALALQLDTTPWEFVEARATFFHDKKRRRDGANFNAQLKAVIDGIVDGGIMPDDSWDHFELLPPKFDTDMAFPRVEITVTKKARSD